MITINQYKKILKGVFDKHPQINTVTFGDDFDFNEESDVVYPVAHISFISPEKIRGDQKIHQFNITIADLYDPNIKGAMMK